MKRNKTDTAQEIGGEATMTGELTSHSTNPIVNFPIEPQVPETPMNLVLKLSDKERLGSFDFPCEDVVVDPKTGERRKARLLTNCPTIWQDEQKSYEQKWIEKNIRTLVFNNGKCVIRYDDLSAIQFITLTNYNIDNPNRFGVKKITFTVWNPLKEAQTEELREMEMLKALQYAATCPLETMKRHAVFLGIYLANDMGQLKTESALRVDYMKKAKADPMKFMNSAVNPAVDINWAIKILINNGTIDTTKQSGQAYFNDGGYICSIPVNESTEAYLTHYATLNEEKSRNFATQIKQLAKI